MEKLTAQGGPEGGEDTGGGRATGKGSGGVTLGAGQKQAVSALRIIMKHKYKRHERMNIGSNPKGQPGRSGPGDAPNSKHNQMLKGLLEELNDRTDTNKDIKIKR